VYQSVPSYWQEISK